MIIIFYYVLCSFISSYAMDVPPVRESAEYERDLAQYIVNNTRKKVDATKDDLLKRVIASNLVSSRMCCGIEVSSLHCLEHGSATHRFLLFPDRKGFIRCNSYEIEISYDGKATVLRLPAYENLYKFNQCKRMREIKACALNSTGSKLAFLDDQYLHVWDNVGTQNRQQQWHQDLSLFVDKKPVAAWHVALSDSGDRAAVYVTVARGIGSIDERCLLVMDTKNKKLLYNLSAFQWFYMMGENIIANTVDYQCSQYDLNSASAIFAQLTQSQKDLLSKVYQQFKMKKKKTKISEGNKDFVTLPEAVKDLVKPMINMKNCSVQ